jgi:C-terminal region of aryl-sulfatase
LAPHAGRYCRWTTGDGLKRQIEAGQYPGIVKTTLDGLDQRDYLEGKSEKSAREVFFYYSGSTPSAVRIKNWKIYYTMSAGGAAGWLEPLKTYHFPLIQNIKRDPFEQYVSPDDTRSLLYFGGSLAAPSTAFMYDGLGIMPLGQQLWLKELDSYITYPPLQAASTYNLTEVINQVKKMHEANPGD